MAMKPTRHPNIREVRWRIMEQHRGQPLDLTRLLAIAIGLAAALSQVHRQGLIHKESSRPDCRESSKRPYRQTLLRAPLSTCLRNRRGA
jgi:hypothetical protein